MARRRRYTVRRAPVGGGEESASGRLPTPTRAELSRLEPRERIERLREIRVHNARIREAEDQARGIPEPYESETPDSYRAAQTLASLLTSSNGQSRAEEWLAENRGIINDTDAEAIGFAGGGTLADILEEYDKNKAEPSVWDRAKGVVGEGLSLLSRPQQAASELWQASIDSIDEAPAPIRILVGGSLAALDRRTDAQREADGGFSDVWRALRGEGRYNPVTGQQDTYIPLFTSLGHERPDGMAGRGYDAAQFVAETAQDPLTYISGGSKAGARPFLDAAATTLGREAAEGGVRSAAPLLSRRLATTAAEDLGDDVIRRALADTGVRGLTREGRDAVLRDLSESVGERAARRSYQAARRFDRGGLRVGIGGPRGFGRSLVPGSAGRALGRIPIGGGRNVLLDSIRFVPQAELERRAIGDAHTLADSLADRASLARYGDDEIEDALVAATGLSYRLDNAAERAAAKQAREEALPDLASALRNAIADRDVRAARDALDEMSDAGIRVPDSVSVPLARATRTGKGVDEALQGAVRFSYQADDRVWRQAARVSARGPHESELIGFDAERLRNALGVRDPNEILDAIKNSTATRRQPGSRNVQDIVEEWRAAMANAGSLDDRARAIRDLADAGDLAGLRRIADDAWLTPRVSQVTERRGLASSARRRFIRPAEEAIANRTRVRNSVFFDGDQVARNLHAIQSEGHAAGFQEGQRRLRALHDGSRVVDDAERRAIVEALDVRPSGAGDDWTPPGLSAEGEEALAFLRREQERMYRTLTEDVGISPERLRDMEDYFPHTLTDEGKRWISDNHHLIPPDVKEALGIRVEGKRVHFGPVTDTLGATGQRGHLNRRGNAMSVTEKNDLLVNALADSGVKVPKEFYELDPFKAMARRGNEVDRALIVSRTFDDASEQILAPDGGRLVMRARPDATDIEKDALREAAETRGLQEIQTSDGSLVFAHPDLAKDMENYVRVLSDDEALNAVSRFVSRWQTLWRGYATVPITGGLGFSHRNALGNVANMYVAGMNDPRYFVRASRLQRQVYKAVSANPEMEIGEALRVAGMNADDIKAVTSALDQGVYRDGFAIADLPRSELATLSYNKSPSGAAKMVGRNINPAGQGNFILRTGGSYNAVIEDNARLAMYLHTLDNTGNPRIAAERVREVLFDYRDLTPFEKALKSYAIPFWTFTRRNLPLQIRNLVNNPGRVARFERGARALLSGPGESRQGDEGWAGRSGAMVDGTFVPSWAPSRGTLTGAGFFGTQGAAFARADTPFLAGLETSEPVFDLAALLSGHGQNELGESVGGADAAGSVLNVLGGGPAEVVKILAEERTGKSLFTGTDIRDRETGERKKNIWLRLSQAVAPAVDKTSRTWGTQDDDPTSQLLWEALTGITVTRVTDENSESAQGRAIEELRDALTAYNKAHPDDPAPSFPELQAAGIVPDPVRDARDAWAAVTGGGQGGAGERRVVRVRRRR